MNKLNVSKYSIKSFLLYLISLISYAVSDVVICTSHSIRLFICRFFFINPNKVHVIQNYIDLTLFTPSSLAITSSPSILFVGRLEHEKRQLLVQEILKTSFSATILGKGSLRQELDLYLQNFDHNITFVDHTLNQNMPDFYHNHNFYVCTSLYEGNPKSVLEACPVVVLFCTTYQRYH